MSSITRLPASPEPLRSAGRRDRERGQILFIFAGGLVAFLAVAALVFDVGQNLLDWRAQRDAADAAALAGSRYIADPTGQAICLSSPSTTNCPTTVAAALKVAEINGYGDGSTNCAPPSSGTGQVCVHIPPIAPGNYTGMSGFLQVEIHTDRPSFFAAVLGVLRQNVDALAIAGNSGTVSPPYSMLALNPDCDPNPSGQVGGNGDVTVAGAVVVNSTCDGALLVNGNGALGAPECDVGGTAQTAGTNASLDCPVTEGFGGTGDPLATKSPGPKPGTPLPVDIVSWQSGGTPTIPPGCPGSTSQITLVGDVITAGDTATLNPPAFAGNDTAIVFAYRTGSNTPPDLPLTGWDSVAAGGSNLNSRRIGYRKLDGTELNVGTWTNATALEVIILRGADTDTPIGVTASANSPTGTMTSPALVGMHTDGHSWVIAFGGATANANVTTLSGTTATLSNTTTPTWLALHYATNRVSWTGGAYGNAATVVGPNITDSIEIRANPNPSSETNPSGCNFSGAGGGKYNVYRIHPGVYYGGLSMSGRTARVYMAPGTYWLAGGGLSITGRDNQLVSVNGATSVTPGRGVFIYDTEDTYYHDQCVAGTAPAGACIGPIDTHGGSSNTPCPSPVQPIDPTYAKPTTPCQWLYLQPATEPVVPVTNLLIFIDRSFAGVDITFNGNAGTLNLAGTIYDPGGQVNVNGGAGDTVSAQIIANTFKITGNGGFTVTYDANGVVQLKGVGLVQ